jgi:hypothetical protein
MSDNIIEYIEGECQPIAIFMGNTTMPNRRFLYDPEADKLEECKDCKNHPIRKVTIDPISRLVLKVETVNKNQVPSAATIKKNIKATRDGKLVYIL